MNQPPYADAAAFWAAVKQNSGPRPDELGAGQPTYTSRQDSAVTELLARIRPGEPAATRLQAIGQAQNPLLEAGRPLLRALAEIPNELDTVEINALHLLLKDAVREFQRLCEQANLRREHMLGARYCLCTALDEAATRTTWGKRESGVAWIREGLATEFHEDRLGGVKIYLLIGRLMAQPHEHIDLLEVIYRILSLGFMGRYRQEADGVRKHDAIRQRIFQEIQAQRNTVPALLAQHTSAETHGKRLSIYGFPLRASFASLGLVLLALFGWYKYQLLYVSEGVEKDIRAISLMRPPPPPHLPRLKELLSNEIAAGIVSVDEDSHHSAVTFRGDTMFAPGSVDVNTAMEPLLAKIAHEVAKVPGKVTITGYTDNVPIRSLQFASNDALSLERATHVMQMLQAFGLPIARLESVGKGEANPVGDNATPQGRAKNRRVEISVTA